MKQMEREKQREREREKRERKERGGRRATENDGEVREQNS